MTQNAVNINILANVREAVRGVDDAADAVEEVGDRLHDLTKEGDTATDRMAADFRDLTKSADRTSDQLRDKFRDAYRDVRRASDDTADEVVRNQRRMGERSAEVGQEIRQNLGEGIANAARGDFAALSDTIGDTFGGAVAGIGGIGFAAAGAAGALGVGAIVAAFTIANEQRDKLQARANDLATAYIQAGSSVLDAMSIAARTSDILTGDERGEAENYARVLGVDLPTAARAMAGDVNALAVVNKLAAEAQRENLEIADKQRESLKALTPEQQQQIQANSELRLKAEELSGVMTEANSKFEEQQSVLRGLVNDAASASKEVDELGNSVYTLPDGTQIMIDAETGQATTDVSKFKGDLDGVPEIITSTVKIKVDSREWDNWRPTTKRGGVQAYRLGGNTMSWE